MESLLERIAASIDSPLDLEKLLPELSRLLENPKPALDFLSPYLFQKEEEDDDDDDTDPLAITTALSSFVWNADHVLGVFKCLVQYKSTLLLPISQSVLTAARNVLLTLFASSQPHHHQSLFVSDTVLHTVLELLMSPDLQISENASQTLLAWTLYHRYCMALLSTSSNIVEATRQMDDTTSPTTAAATPTLNRDELLHWDKRLMEALVHSYTTWTSTMNIEHSNLQSTFIIRYASTLTQLMSLEWQWKSLQLQEEGKVDISKKIHHPLPGLQEVVWVKDFLYRVHVKIGPNEDERIIPESHVSQLVLQQSLLDIFLIQPFHKALDPSDVLGRINLLDMIDSVVVSMVHPTSKTLLDPNMLTWLNSTTVLSTLLNLLGRDLENMDASLIYMIPPSSSTSSMHNCDSLVSNFRQYHHQHTHETIPMGEEEEKGCILRILSHIFYATFLSLKPKEKETQHLESQQLYLWSGIHISLSYFVTTVLLSGRRYDQEAKRLAFIDAMSTYVTTSPWILSSFLEIYESLKSPQHSGSLLICESWLDLRHVQGHLKGSILGSIATVLENTSSPSLRVKFITCIGQVNSSSIHGISMLANFCRLSPTVEVRVGAYRCLHALIHEDVVVQRLFQDPQVQFFDFISGRLGNESTKEAKEAKHRLLCNILEKKQSHGKWISESQWKELELIVRNGPFAIPPASVSDPLFE